MEFRAIIPVGLWQWNQESQVYIRFGIPQLGNWDYDYGPGIEERYTFIIIMPKG